MKKVSRFLIIIAVLSLSASFLSAEHEVRPSALAGQWYPDDAAKIKQGLLGLIQHAKKVELEQTVRGLILPHASYYYSGRAAAAGYRLISDCAYKRVIILAPAHTAMFHGASIMQTRNYVTPLGKVPVDVEVRDKLLQNELFQSVERAHVNEHSIEIQLPFLQFVLRPGFKIVPVLIGSVGDNEIVRIADALRPYMDNYTLVIASSDFTHHGPRFRYDMYKKNQKSNLYKLDHDAFAFVKKYNQKGFTNFVKVSGATICGVHPIGILIHLMKGKAVTELDYYTSGDITGDWTNSVSYLSAAFTDSGKSMKKDKPKKDIKKNAKKDTNIMSKELSKKEQQTLLTLARETLETWIKEQKVPEDIESRYDITNLLKEEMGVFVTLNKKSRLRGCIGYVTGQDSLYRSVMANAVNASTRDPRFRAVTPDELKEIHIEISVMTPLTEVKDIEEIEVGKHGLVMSKGFRRGLLLPQVPVEWKWNRTEFLENTCRKAGLPTGCWKDEDVKIEKFSAQVFGEE